MKCYKPTGPCCWLPHTIKNTNLTTKVWLFVMGLHEFRLLVSLFNCNRNYLMMVLGYGHRKCLIMIYTADTCHINVFCFNTTNKWPPKVGQLFLVYLLYFSIYSHGNWYKKKTKTPDGDCGTTYDIVSAGPFWSTTQPHTLRLNVRKYWLWSRAEKCVQRGFVSISKCVHFHSNSSDAMHTRKNAFAYTRKIRLTLFVDWAAWAICLWQRKYVRFDLVLCADRASVRADCRIYTSGKCVWRTNIIPRWWYTRRETTAAGARRHTHTHTHAVRW